MTVAYDGRGFSGFAPNPGVRTVGGVLADALARVVGHPVTLACAGRTDSGVHAWGQVVSFDTGADRLDLDRLRDAVNHQVGPAVVVRHAAVAPDGFDARHSATARVYRYAVLNRAVPDPFLAATAWHVPTPLDLPAMRLGADALVGEHDFSSFCRAVKRADPPPSLVRRVVEARWEDLGDGLLRFGIEANAFCHQMVRSLVGTLVDMGRGRLRAGDMTTILRSGDRHRAGNLAPPHGLCLWLVRYDGDDGYETSATP